MSHFNPGDVIVHSTWCGPSVLQIVSGDDDGLIMRAADGHDEFWPTSQHINLGDYLAKFRHASPAERDAFAARLPNPLPVPSN